MRDRGDRVLVWDLETKVMPEDGETNDAYIQRCGISVAAVWDSLDSEWSLYGSRDLDALAEKLEKSDLVVGYNSIGFDHLVLDHNTRRRVIFNELDLWRVIQASMGATRWGTGQGTLDAVSRRTLGRRKSGSGRDAPALAANGQWFELANYCMNDVMLTRELWEFMEMHGYVIDPMGLKHKVGKFKELEGQDADVESVLRKEV